MPIDNMLLQKISENDRTLTELNLSGQGITDEDIVKLVTALKNNTHLKKLNLNANKEFNKIQTAKDRIKDFAETGQIPANENYITAKGAALLAQTKLTHVYLDHNPIGDEGAISLAQNTNLIELTIRNCNLTLRGISAFLNHPAIQELWYQNNPLTNFSIENEDELEDDLNKKIEERLKQNKLAVNSALAQQFTDDSNEAIAVNAALGGDLETLIAFLPKLKDGIETRDNGFNTLLSCAAGHGHAHIVEYLLVHGANIEQDSRNYTPLFEAAEQGHAGVVEVLLGHTGNILGEFKTESAYSIAIFKLCHNIVILNSLLTKNNITPPCFPEDNFNSLFNSLDITPWQLFEEPKTQAYFLRAAVNYIKDLNNLIKQQKELFEQPQLKEQLAILENYRRIVWLLHNRIVAIVNKVDKTQLETNNYDTDGEASDDSDDEDIPFTPRHRITSVTTAKKVISSEQANEWIAKLNQDIKEHGIENIDWSNYPKLFIANYRGVHFYRDQFTPQQRRLYRRDSHLNRITACSAAYELSDNNTPAHAQFTQETQLTENAARLRSWHKDLENIKNPKASWEKSRDKRIFKTGRQRHQQIYSNIYDRYNRELNTPGTFLHQEAQPLGHTKVPFLSTALGPHHALRYAYGQKAPKNLKQYRLRPRFTKTGKTKRPYPGKVFVFLFSPADLLRHDVNHVVSMHAQGDVDIGYRIVPEGEVSAAGGIEQKNNFFEYAVKIPNFERYQDFYQKKYGLSKKRFEELKKGIIDSKPGTQGHKDAKNAIINELMNYQEAYLLQVVNKEVEKQGGILVYQNLDGGFSLTPPDINEAKKRNKLAKEKKTSAVKKTSSTKKRPASDVASSAEPPLKKRKTTKNFKKNTKTTSPSTTCQLLSSQQKKELLQEIKVAIEQKNYDRLKIRIQFLQETGNLAILNTQIMGDNRKLGNVINLAAASVFPEGIALLLEALPTINCDLRNSNNGKTALEEVLDSLGYGESAIKALTLLLKQNANPNTIIEQCWWQPQRIGYTPLNWLINQTAGILFQRIKPENFFQATQLLLHYGANPNLEGSEGLLPLAHIIKEIKYYGEKSLEYYQNLIHLLLYYGAKIALLDAAEQQYILAIIKDFKPTLIDNVIATPDEMTDDVELLTHLFEDSPTSSNNNPSTPPQNIYYDDEHELDRAALESQRAMHLIKVNDENKQCIVVPADADGNCGFTATRRYLFLQDKKELAANFYRDKFISLIARVVHDPNDYQLYQNYIMAIFKTDNANSIEEWKTKFKSSGYWLQDAHFYFLSKYFNLEFNFYCVPFEEDQNALVPELSYESIYGGSDLNSRIGISLAHVSTRLRSKHDATLNHYDAIIIEPTIEQTQAIANQNYDFSTAVSSNSKISEYGMFSTNNKSLNPLPEQLAMQDFYQKQLQ